MEAYVAKKLPEAYVELDYSFFMNELIDASSALAVYMSKIMDSKVNGNWFLPTLQQNEALKSSMMEGTQATLDGVLVNQLSPNEDDKNLNEISNYFNATTLGIKMLRRGDFDNDLFFSIHRTLLSRKVRRCTDTIGEYRTNQNYIGKDNGELIYIPPKSESVPELMSNLLEFINKDDKTLRPLIKVAIIHAQFETIHPFGDGNGRVGRILIPLYLYAQNQIQLPFFFISEALERDKHKYHKLLMDIRTDNKWNEWIKFFLETVSKQCNKYINMIDEMNALYDEMLNKTCDLIKSPCAVKLIDLMFKHPIFDTKSVQEETDISQASINRYLNILIKNDILFTDGKQRNRHFFFYDLLKLLRD